MPGRRGKSSSTDSLPVPVNPDFSLTGKLGRYKNRPDFVAFPLVARDAPQGSA